MATKEEKQQLIDTLKFTPCTYRISMWGYGGEKVMGRVDPAAWDYCIKHQLDLVDLAWGDYDEIVEKQGLDIDQLPFTPGSWYECDSMAHVHGVSRNAGTIQITDDNGNTVFEKSLDDIVGGGCDGEPDWCCNDEVWIGQAKKGEVVFIGSSNEKGTFFEGDIELKAPFDIEKLELHYDEVDGEEIVNLIYYNDEEIENYGGSTDGKSSDMIMVRLTDDRGNWERYEPDNIDDEENLDIDINKHGIDPEVSSWPTVHETGTDDPVDFPEVKLTDWFPKKIKPVRVGRYETKTTVKPAWPFPAEQMLEWTGKNWKDDKGNIIKEVIEWRGLREPVL
jgi:hypothetical protein